MEKNFNAPSQHKQRNKKKPHTYFFYKVYIYNKNSVFFFCWSILTFKWEILTRNIFVVNKKKMLMLCVQRKQFYGTLQTDYSYTTFLLWWMNECAEQKYLYSAPIIFYSGINCAKSYPCYYTIQQGGFFFFCFVSNCIYGIICILGYVPHIGCDVYWYSTATVYIFFLFEPVCTFCLR